MDIQTPRHTLLTSTVDEKEIAHFNALADGWWDESGPYKILHQINPLRLDFIRTAIGKTSLEGLKILDIGCGGGLVSEPLARLGAQVTAIDGSTANIEAAKAHALSQGLQIDYRVESPENLIKFGHLYDVVLAVEVLEHVSDLNAFMDACAQLTAPEGCLILSTLNQTIASYLLGIIAAEHILKWVPQGTHQWNKFIRPRKLQQMLMRRGFEDLAFKGMSYRPFSKKWVLGDALEVNYFVSAYRQKNGKNGNRHFFGELSSWG